MEDFQVNMQFEAVLILEGIAQANPQRMHGSHFVYFHPNLSVHFVTSWNV